MLTVVLVDVLLLRVLLVDVVNRSLLLLQAIVIVVVGRLGVLALRRRFILRLRAGCRIRILVSGVVGVTADHALPWSGRMRRAAERDHRFAFALLAVSLSERSLDIRRERSIGAFSRLCSTIGAHRV